MTWSGHLARDRGHLWSLPAALRSSGAVHGDAHADLGWAAFEYYAAD